MAKPQPASKQGPSPRSGVEVRVDARYCAMLTLFDQPPDVTALFAADDRLAFDVVRAALDRGRAVPSGLSVVGFDDIAVSAVSVPHLTMVRQPLDELAIHVLDGATRPGAAASADPTNTGGSRVDRATSPKGATS